MILHSAEHEKFEHVSSVTHEGKVVLVATAADSSLCYSVKQDGFEDSYLQADPAHRTGWEKWQEVPLPGRRRAANGDWEDEKDPDDQSVIDKEKEEFAVPKGSDKLEDLIIRSRYKTYDQSALAPVQLVSGLGHLYLFRQSKTGTLLVDRFVLDGMTNELVRKLEVRFKRSGQKYQPLQSTQNGKPGKLATIDSLDFRDANNLPFYEPTTELSLIKNLQDGWFSVVLVPTTDHDVSRWHIFTVAGGKLEIVSIQSSEEGLFDIKDHLVTHPKVDTISGIVRRTMMLMDNEGKELHPSNGIAATKYDLQTEQQTEDGPQLMRQATRIMLAVPTSDGKTAAISFAVATDGTLSRIDEKPEGTGDPLRSTKREIMLPLNTLDEIRTIGDSTPPPQGEITGLRSADDRVVVTTSAGEAALKELGRGDFVEIKDTVSYDGHYGEVKRHPSEKEPLADTYGVELPRIQGDPGVDEPADSSGSKSMGNWTKLEQEESGLVYDGIITGLRREGDLLGVISPGHGLKTGEEVQIDATRDCNGVYRIAEIGAGEFSLERKWQPGESINVRREAGKRRGIQFNDAFACLETPVLELDDPMGDKPCGTTISAWVYVPEGGAADRLLIGQKDESVQLSLKGGHVVLEVNAPGVFETAKDPEPALPEGGWIHYAAVVSSTRNGAGSLKTTLALYRNGAKASNSESGVLPRIRKLQAGDRAAIDFFGGSAAICGDTAIIGAWGESSHGRNTGAAYVFKRQGENWIRQGEKLQVSHPTEYHYFGCSVAICGDTVIVGGLGHGGSAYVFERKGGKWGAPQGLQAGNKDGRFGCSVAISGDTAIVGSEGSAYVFERRDGNWIQQGGKLQAADTEADDSFGCSVAISEDTAIVGAKKNGGSAGAVYVYRRTGETWTQQGEKLQAGDKRAHDFFGSAVAVDGNSAIIGACDEKSGKVSGAYIFERQGGKWNQREKLRAGARESNDWFGFSVAICGDTAIVGASSEDAGATDAGAAYLFKRKAGKWSQEGEKLQAGDRQAGDRFGISVAIGAGTAIVGAYGDDTGAGAAYLFKIGGEPKFWIGKFETEDGAASGPIKLADVQIWNRTRAPQEIKDSMYLTLTGKETDLAGYWRMGGIVPGEPRTVVDFSVHGCDATVHGDAFVAAKSLDRNLAMKIDGKPVPATKYVNEELFAVSQRASYVESFEFKIDGTTPAPKDLFTFSYWGQRSRGNDERIPISAQPPSEPTSTGGGWYVVSCRFFVPDGVTLVRSFGISLSKAAPSGDWSGLHVRKHAITRISDCITEERLDDLVPLPILADDEESLKAVKTLDELEKKEGALLRRKRRLEMLLSGDARWAELIRKKREKIAAQVRKNAGWESDRDYWKVEFDQASLKATLYQDEYLNSWHRAFPIGRHVYSDWGFGVTSVEVPKGLRVRMFISTTWTGWNCELTETNYNLGKLHGNWFNDATASVEIETLRGNTDAEHVKREWNRFFRLHAGGVKVLAALEKSRDEFLAARKTDPRTLREELDKVKAELKELTGRFAEPYTRVLNGVAEARQRALTMPWQLKDDRGLITTGALLGFVRPCSRLSAFETCEGNVRLSYFDAAGRMRQTHYDAVADSANSRFEQWLSDGLRSCINFNQSGGPLALPEEKSLPLLEAWTIEAWVSFPLADADDLGGAEQPKYWRCLAGSGDGKDGYLVTEYDPAADLELLGVRVAGEFKSSDLDLTQLADGWHHIAATGRDGAVVFHIDGKQVSSYPTAEKLENAKKVEAESTSDARRLADFRRQLAEAKSRKDEKTVEKLSGTVGKLEKIAGAKQGADKIAAARAAASATLPTKPVTNLGGATGGHAKPFGKVAELRIWDAALSEEEIEANSKTLLSGNEPDLLAYYPMDEASGNRVRDQSGNGHTGTMKMIKWWGCAAPIGLVDPAESGGSKIDGVVISEYSTISQNPGTGRKTSMMRRCVTFPSADGIAVLADKRIEELELIWVGNAQFAPTLLGYIEGAPPIPSENLTVRSSYNSATSVKLTSSEDVAYSWARATDSGLGAKTDIFLGTEVESDVNTGIPGATIITKTLAAKSGAKGNFDAAYKLSNKSDVVSKSTIQMSDSLELRGTQEQKAKFPHLGKRFIPKNVGYALVVSALADVFITRLRRSKRMIGYQTIPVEDVPPDINTITFLINPAYTMVGSLDGMTGTRATSDRFTKHVPEMRAQFGSQYPASFFRLKEAYDLKNQIDRRDKARESFFNNFNSRLTDNASLEREANSGDAPTPVGVRLAVDEKPEGEATEGEKKAATADQIEQDKKTGKENVARTSKAAEDKRAKIEETISDREKRTQAQAALAVWQKRMEDLQIRAGKHNIVNNYVWDADGGMRTEVQSFANTAAHTVGGSANFNVALGGTGTYFGGGLSVALTAQATASIVQTMAKTQSHTSGFGLDVNVGGKLGVEFEGVTDHNDRPLMPGEKVDRYRFMSFYLEGSTKNFNDFFDYVVDPEWLASNDEEARALRQANGKANKTWRVLHRVTYVERPALMGFGRDLRKLPEEHKPSVEEQVQSLAKAVAELKEMVKNQGD